MEPCGGHIPGEVCGYIVAPGRAAERIAEPSRHGTVLERSERTCQRIIALDTSLTRIALALKNAAV